MKKISILLSGFLLFAGAAMAQSSYILHKIIEGETLSQLAKKYHTSVGDIMRLNKMTTDSKLFVGEEVKIPMVNAPNSEGSTATPDMHTVAKGETLYQLSKKYEVSVANLIDWNNIVDSTITVGQVLKLKAPKVNAEGIDALLPDTKNTVGDKIDRDSTAVMDNVNPPAQEIVPSNNKPKNESVFDQVNATPVTTEEGLYAPVYKANASGTELITKGTAGVFKSASGWQDKKYFILMNAVKPGTVVKVQANGKTIYAKVLWNLGNVKINEGLSYRLCDAAASKLGLNDEKFDLIVSYFK